MSRLSKETLRRYLTQREKKPVKILEYKKLGQGWHAEGFEVAYSAQGERKDLVLRRQKPLGFSHEYPSDRANGFILSHQLSRLIPKHIKSYDILSLSKNTKAISLGAAQEFFQLVEKVTGKEYGLDLEEILKRGKLTLADRRKALLLSNYLANLHMRKFRGSKVLAKSIHRRHSRDAFGHGEMLLGVLDTYPDKLSWFSDKERLKLLEKALRLREKIKDSHNRLCRIHGDFHPGNIVFQDEKNFKVLDASRELWGEPADDLTALLINYVWFAIRDKGKFAGPFAGLYKLFLDNYIKKTRDFGIAKAMGLFFAFRAVVIMHPTFYPRQSPAQRKKIYNFIMRTLK